MKQTHTGILITILVSLAMLLVIVILGIYQGVVTVQTNTITSSSSMSSESSSVSISTSSEVSTTTTSSESSMSTSSSTSSTVSANVKVYFSKTPASTTDPSKTFAVNRVSSDLGVAKYVVGELIKGPTAGETALGYFSKVKVTGTSNCGGASFTITISEAKKATLKFCKDFVSEGGVVSDAQAQSEIEASLTQFPTITKVVILDKDGNCLFDQSGLNNCLSD